MKRIFNAIRNARQRRANQEIARILKSTEYSGEDYDHILYRLNNGEVEW